MDECVECHKDVGVIGLGNICNDCAAANMCYRCRKNARASFAELYCVGCR